MSQRIWDKFLTKRDKAVFAAGGFGARAGFGKRPALLVIDVNWAFCGERPEPILDSIKRWRTSCGSCHDSDAAGAHFDAMTSSIGNESCSVCHDSGRDLPVTIAHKIR